MLIAATVLLSLITGLLAGFYSREVKNRLKLIETAVRALYARQQVEEQKEKKMTFAGPVDLDELTDREKIEYLNQ